MTAGDYVQLIVKEEHWPDAQVFIFKRDIHTIAKPEELLPDEDDLCTIMIRVPDTT